jgi:4-hydroxybenzoate polyprenyltransferase
LIVTILVAISPRDAGWAWFGLILLLYFILQLAYTFMLKHIVLVDLFAISAGFILRAVAGAAILLVNITPWWLLSLFFLALFLGLGKRRNELQVLGQTAGNHRRTLEEYSPQFLDYLLLIDIASTIVVYSLATFTAPVVTRMKYPFLMLTIPLVVFALFRYLYLIIQKGEGGEPADLVMHDSPMLVTIISWGFLVLATQVVR